MTKTGAFEDKVVLDKYGREQSNTADRCSSSFCYNIEVKSYSRCY